jgi:hypothetical protein
MSDCICIVLKLKFIVNALYSVNNLIIQNYLQTAFPVKGKDYFCAV